MKRKSFDTPHTEIYAQKGGATMLPTDELIDFAIKIQPFYLDLELQKGVPLNYIDQNGNYVLRYPDGHIEKADLKGIVDRSCPK